VTVFDVATAPRHRQPRNLAALHPERGPKLDRASFSAGRQLWFDIRTRRVVKAVAGLGLFGTVSGQFEALHEVIVSSRNPEHRAAAVVDDRFAVRLALM